MTTSRSLLLIALLSAATAVTTPARGQPEPIDVAGFGAGDRSQWQAEIFAGETVYDFVPFAGGTALHARAAGTASGLYREMEIDLRKTPVVTWRWALGAGKAGLDPRRKAGDDYPLRLYFVVKRGLFNLDTIAVQYVWSLSQPVGSSWSNPFASGVRQIAVDSGPAPTGEMVAHRRNLREDFKALFGETIDRINVIAIMTDADNAGGISEGWYGDVRFVAE
jgi:hypothetical protein